MTAVRQIMAGTAKKSKAARTMPDDRARALKLVPVAPSVEARLDRFVELLRQWQRRINLVGESTTAHIWTRHVADSLQLLSIAPEARIWIDLGSGGGFPGLVLACALADVPTARVHLVESNGKKAAFLREAVRALGLRAVVHADRIEDFTASFPDRADIICARALAPLSELLELAAPLLKTGAKGLFLKGQDIEVELTEAAKCWTIKATLVDSKTARGGHIVVVDYAARRVKS